MTGFSHMQQRQSKPYKRPLFWGIKVLGTSAALAMVLTGCKFDGTGTKMQWAPDMADSPTSKPQKSFLDPPLHSVAMNAVFYEKTPEAAETVHFMPADIAADSDGKYLAKGKVLFETFCAVCHGVDGKGQNLLGPTFSAPPDITHPSYLERKDGFFFYRITFGTAVMPAYGYATLPEERWLIVKHLRTLQSR
jgi:mono/diheme cytochrome c family protein